VSNKGKLLKGNKLSNNNAIGINEMWCLWKLVGTYYKWIWKLCFIW
jgi:hypothetical protein